MDPGTQYWFKSATSPVHLVRELHREGRLADVIQVGRDLPRTLCFTQYNNMPLVPAEGRIIEGIIEVYNLRIQWFKAALEDQKANLLIDPTRRLAIRLQDANKMIEYAQLISAHKGSIVFKLLHAAPTEFATEMYAMDSLVILSPPGLYISEGGRLFTKPTPETVPVLEIIDKLRTLLSGVD